MKDYPPFHLTALIFDGTYHFNGEQWTRDKDSNETFNKSWARDSILRSLNSDSARQGLLSCVPRYAHAEKMLEFAVGSSNWKILSVIGNDNRERVVLEEGSDDSESSVATWRPRYEGEDL